jgi:secondary thiamine-phosphate synthase enzyme
MQIISEELVLRTTAGTDIVDLTGPVQDQLSASGVVSGIVVLFVPGSTGALTTIEYESGVLEDLKRVIEQLAPKDTHYEHDRRWGDGNGYSHVRAALMKPSLSIPIQNGRLALGTWQQIVLMDFDNRPRDRRVLMQILGEGEKF